MTGRYDTILIRIEIYDVSAPARPTMLLFTGYLGGTGLNRPSDG